MEKDRVKGIIEAILFASGREVKINELMSVLEINSKEIIDIVHEMQQDYAKDSRGIQIIKVEEGFQLTTKKELYEYLYPIFDKRSKPNLSQASLETLSIIAYNPRISRADIDQIRGVNSDATVHKLLEYDLIETAGKLDLPGKPMSYKVSNEFLKMFGITSMDELPELPKFKLDSNRQIVIDELIEEQKEEIEKVKGDAIEAPSPEREDSDKKEDESIEE